MTWDSLAVKDCPGAIPAQDRLEPARARLGNSSDLSEALGQIDRALVVATESGRWQIHDAGASAHSQRGAFVPACRLENLGDAGFRADHGLRYAYLAGSMANGIGSVEIVQALGRAGMLAFFGAAGLTVDRVADAVDRLQGNLKGTPFGVNLIHSPAEPAVEAGLVDLFLRKGIRLVEASAYLDLTLPVVRYRLHGIGRDSAGRISAPNRIIAKVSRVEVASKFLAPPPAALLRQLATAGDITEAQADMARGLPMAQDITAEADSAGHTDNRPAITLLPTMIALRNRMHKQHGYHMPIRIGAAGGIATPAAAAAAFTMGAAYVMTGSINQACVESGSSDVVREMLSQAEQADVIMAPAADMFEMGVRLQVLKRGTLFAMRAAKLYEIYRNRASLDDIPVPERDHLEKTIFRLPLAEVWTRTRDFFGRRDPAQLARADKDAKHKMALVFRWYLGLSSRWANQGEPDRKIDYQVWCGPAMGAFNEWVKGSFLEQPRNRRVVPVALNILYGAAVLFRSQALSLQGVPLPADVPNLAPVEPGAPQQRFGVFLESQKQPSRGA